MQVDCRRHGIRPAVAAAAAAQPIYDQTGTPTQSQSASLSSQPEIVVYVQEMEESMSRGAWRLEQIVLSSDARL